MIFASERFSCEGREQEQELKDMLRKTKGTQGEPWKRYISHKCIMDATVWFIRADLLNRGM